MIESKIGQKVRVILVGNRYYTGTILKEDENLILILDKFGNQVSFGKASIISMEVLE